MSDMNIRALVRGYASGEFDPRRVLEQVFAKIEQAGVQPVWISLNSFDACLRALRVAEAQVPRGPLFGVPFGVKDNIDVHGLPTTAACPEFSYMPARNAEVVDRLVRAGAIVIGKTNLDQFATGLVGTRSPYGACSSVFDDRYISGGSSSGSAVAVARGEVSFALGTDTAGSGRVPAAFNGLVGVKPTRGLLSTRGVVPACRTLDCVSIFAADMEDAALVFDQCAGFDPEDSYSRPREPRPCSFLETPRFGVPEPGQLKFFGDGESEVAYSQFVAELEARGWKKSYFDFEPFSRAAALLYEGPWVAERAAAIGGFLSQAPNAGHPVVRAIVEGANKHTASDAFRAMYELAELRRQIRPLWSTLDAVLLPTAPTHYRIEEVLADPVRLNQNLGTYTNFANLLDLCAIAVPAGVKKSGLPFGVTWFAPSFHDGALFDIVRRSRCEAVVHRTRAPSGHVWLAVAGAHLSGQPLNGQLTRRGARLVKTTTTLPEYRLFALKTSPPKPGLVHAPAAPGGAAIEVEVWELEEAAFGSFTHEVPAPMTIGTTHLVDGTSVKGFCCEAHALDGAQDITRYGGWRAYVAS